LPERRSENSTLRLKRHKSTIRRTKAVQDASNRQFCSRLVAQSYAFAPVKLVPNADYCYPKDLGDSSLLRVISDCLRQASDAELRFAEDDNPLERQTQATNFILAEIRKLTGSDIQTFEQPVPYLMANPQHDKEVAEMVRASGYLYLWAIDVDRNRWRYDSAVFQGLPISRAMKS